MDGPSPGRKPGFRRRAAELAAAGLLAISSTLAMPPRLSFAADRFAAEHDTAAWFAEGQRKFNAGEWEQAAAELSRLATSCPTAAEAPQAVYLAGESLVYLQQYDAARGRFDHALKQGLPEQLAKKALFRKAEAAFLGGKIADAQQEFEQFRKQFPKDELNAYTYLYLGQAALLANQAANAKNYFTLGLRDYAAADTSLQMRFGLAQAMQRQGDLQGALRHFESLIATDDPIGETAAVQVAAVRFQAGDLDGAWNALQPLMQRDTKSPNTAQACYWATRVLCSQNKAFEAAALAEEALEVHPFEETAGLLHYAAADAWRLADNQPAAMSQYEEVWLNYSASDFADVALYQHIRLASEVNDQDLIDDLAVAFSRIYPASTYRLEVKSLQCRALLREQRFEEAQIVCEDFLADLGDRSSPRKLAAKTKGTSAQIAAGRYYLAASLTGLRRFSEAVAVLQNADPRLLAPELAHDFALTRCDAWQGTGRHAEAVAFLRQHLQKHGPEDDTFVCRSRLILALAEAGQWKEAQEELQAFRKAEPEDGEIAKTALSLAEKAYFAGQSAIAADIYEKLIHANDHANFVTQATAGLAWVRSAGSLTEANDETVKVLLQRYPDSPLAPVALMQRGRALEQSKELERAAETYHLLAEYFPRTEQAPQSLLSAARLQDQLQQPDKTVALLSRLMEEYPNYVHMDAVFYQWAWALIDLKQDSDGDDLLRRLTNEFPNSRYYANAAHRLAVRSVEADDLTSARYYLDRFLTLDTERTERIEVLLLRCDVAVKAKQYHEVPHFARQVVALQGDQTQRWQAEYWTAEASYRQGDFASAARQFTRLDREARVKDEPFAKLLRLRRAQSLALSNDWEKVPELAADLARYQKSLPQPEELDLLQARILIHQNKPAQARELLTAITKKTSDSAARAELAGAAWLLMGASWEQEANFAAAASEYLRGYEKAELPDWQALCLLQAGKCFEGLREMRRAREAYAIVLDDFADTASAAEARDRLTASVSIAQGDLGSRVR